MCKRVKFWGSAQLNARVMAAKFLSALCFTTIDSNFSFGRLQHRHSRTMRKQEGDRKTRKNTSTNRRHDCDCHESEGDRKIGIICGCNRKQSDFVRMSRHDFGVFAHNRTACTLHTHTRTAAKKIKPNIRVSKRNTTIRGVRTAYAHSSRPAIR